MKTLKEVLNAIKKTDAEANESIKGEEHKDAHARRNKARKELFIMRLARNYLEFNPTLESVKTQKEDVTRWLQIDEERFNDYKNRNSKIKVDREMYYKNCDVDKKELSKWKSELKFLNYILA